MQGNMVRVGRERNTTAPLVAAAPISIVNILRIVGAAIHALAKVDVMCLKLLILYRMLIVHRYTL